MKNLRLGLTAIAACHVLSADAPAAESVPAAKAPPAAAPLPPAAATPDISGQWTAVFEISTGLDETRFTFKVEGDRLTGTSSSRAAGNANIFGGRINRDTVTWFEQVTAVSNGMLIDLQYTGKIVSADEIRLTREVGTYRTQETVAKRVKEPATAPAVTTAPAAKQ